MNEAGNHEVAPLDALWAARALRACFTPNDIMPPRELLLAAFACAGKGTLLGIPAEYLRDLDAVDWAYDEYGTASGELDLSEGNIDADGMQLLALLLPGSQVKHLKHAPRPEPIRSFVVSGPPLTPS